MTDVKYYTPHGCCIEAYYGDITKENCDAIVCASNPSVSRYNGLLGEIKAAGGSSIMIEVNKNLEKLPGGRIKRGQVLVTGAGKMKCKHVMYVNGLDISHGDTTITYTIVACLGKARDMNLQSIAFPALGSGRCGINYNECVEQYVHAISLWSCDLPKVIKFVIIDEEMFNKIKDSFKANFTKWHPSTKDSTSNTNTEEKREIKRSGVKSRLRNQPRSESVLTEPLESFSSTTSNTSLSTVPNDVEGASGGQSEDCPICLCPISEAKTLDLCGHVFCQPCIDHSFSAIGQYCPICLKIYGVITGNQPSSSMVVHETYAHLAGFQNSQTYQIVYRIPSGVQGKNHPNPGKSYHGTDRTAFLPKTEQGTIVLKMLQLAFNRRLVFTVGNSRTTNMENMVTWNDIHHKTSCTGGPSGFGYPDDNYLDRVSNELAAKGITPEDVAYKKVKSKISIA